MTKTTPTILETHRVPELSEKQRLQDYAVGIFKRIISRKGTKKAIKAGRIFVNGIKGHTGDWIKGGEEICLYEAVVSKKPKLNIPLDVLFEDDYLAVVFKPAGVLVSGNKRFTLENALSFNLKKSSQLDALQRPEPIHRLDYPTTGALLIGKTASIVIQLNALFENRQIEKQYVAVTQGIMQKAGFIETEIDGKASKSEFQKLDMVNSERFKALNLVLLQPHTGRRHQLRKHLSGMGNPILGDSLYTEEALLLKGKGLYLHAYSLSFQHPITEKAIFCSARLPKKYLKIFPEAHTLLGE
ncbi:RluA family pseudouridine synthase [Aureisphaera galaxeae]|uniref:RluA family pseudouridine synthase n=1 Tax=Aureisphaera galaxeae TaxID=1538023 RepID=UPI002350E779|nr:RluA family pseudouridine synthase [Aureisphaera galaxeae]MDC8005009.1 RluA family pseudouridine synthase [Aureisphaera galaxeae]